MEQNEKIYNVLRPRNMDEMYVTNKWIKIMRDMKPENIAGQAYLIYGNKGSGKTTFSRMIAKHIGCIEPTEINAANERRMEDMRALKERMSLTPLLDNYTVITIDEAGEITPGAQKMFLKELEDSPPHICIILCTTDIDKIIETIYDRCVKINLRKLEESDSPKFMKYINKIIDKRKKEYGSDSWIPAALEKMKSKIDEVTLTKLIDCTHGSIRDLINGMYSYAMTGELPSIIGEQSDVNDVIKETNKGNWQNVINLIYKLQIEDVLRIQKILARKSLYSIANTGNSKKAKLVDDFLKPFDPKIAREVLVSRLMILVTNWKQ